MRTRDFAQLTWPEIRDAIDAGAGIIVPVGATEQHGHHLPLATDALLATALARAVAEAADMLVAPVVSYGYRSRPLSGGGSGFVGTTSLRGRTLMDVVEDVLADLLRQVFRRVALLNWHMENQNFIYESAWLAIERRREPAARIMVLESPFEDVPDDVRDAMWPDGFPGWGVEHAARFETSLMLHLHPELVLADRAVDDRAERLPWWDVVPTPPDLVPASGTLWTVAGASAEMGRLVWEAIVAQTTAAVLEELPVPSAHRNGARAQPA
jgi:creatinine amidohydrolase